MNSFESVPLVPADVMFELTVRFNADTHSEKVSLGAGAYRDSNGKPWILPSIQSATDLLAADPSTNHEYGPIEGLASFTTSAARLVVGSTLVDENRVASVQTISGTGACHLAALFLSRFYAFPDGDTKEVWIPNPTWANHAAILENVGITAREYPYYDAEKRGFDFEGFAATVEGAKDQSVFLLHACAHNPTGYDPTPEQWEVLAEIFERKSHFAFWDSAYQGFNSGDLEKDRFAIDLFSSRAIPGLVAQSFSKNAGLYGERVGCCHVICKDSRTRQAVHSQLKALTRCEVSTPPVYGAKLVNLVLNTPELYEQWKKDIVVMATRIKEMRAALFDAVVKAGTPGSWEHIVEQQGMFSYTGLSAPQCEALLENYHIYLPDNGRISIAGLTWHNVEYVAECFSKVVKDFPPPSPQPSTPTATSN
ncbi:hypothetical protein P7C70_g6367, partial [Phenoliferia sp. Uapishka_3]